MVSLLFLSFSGCLLKSLISVEIQAGPELLMVDRGNGFSPKFSVLAETRNYPFGKAPLSPFFRSSVSFHDFQAMADTANWYIDFAQWDDLPLAMLYGTIGVPYMVMVPFYGSKLNTGAGFELPKGEHKWSPTIELGANMGVWLEPSNEDFFYSPCVGMFSSYSWNVDKHILSLKLSYDWPILPDDQKKSNGIIGSALTWGYRL